MRARTTDRPRAERALRSARRIFWAMLAVLGASVLFVLGALLAGASDATIGFALGLMLGLLLSWVYLANGLNRLERDLAALGAR